MARRSKKRDPFSVKLGADEEREFTEWLCDEITSADSARQALTTSLDYWHGLYEQASRGGQKPWPDAADLTSYLASENLDALRARMVKTIMVEPVWTVEGWGPSADRAAIVEEFHQWKLEEERLQQVLAKVFHQALLEGTGVLEVYERAERRVQMRQERVAIQVNEEGGVALDEDGQPQPQRDATGAYIEVQSSEQPAVDLVVRDPSIVRRGPGYRVLSLRDFWFLPGHAYCADDLWGYAKRFWMRVPELERRQKEGVYRNIDQVGTEDERVLTQPQQRAGLEVSAAAKGGTAEKELYEVLLLRDLDGDGLEEWYVATLSVRKRVLLRLQHDDLGLPRYLPFTPMPRPESVYGYSFVGNKLATICEEHTALRNMIADRSALVTNAPLKRVQGALWDPDVQPWGPRSVIDVRDVREIEPVQVPDVPASAIERERSILDAAKRISGLNDIALGQQPQESRTLGEVQLATEQSFVRMEECIRNVQETLEDLWRVRHVLWIRALEQEEQGQETPASFTRTLEAKGLELPNGQMDADLLRGTFRGKPRGSVETADLMRLRSDFNGLLQALAGMAKMFPPLGQMLMRPEAMQALLEQLLRVYRVPDRQAFLGPPGAMQAAMAPMGVPGMGGVAPMGVPMPGRIPGPMGPGVGAGGPAPAGPPGPVGLAALMGGGNGGVIPQ